MRRTLSILCLCLVLGGFVEARTRRRAPNGPFLATAFAQEGITRSGTYTRRGVVAADPRVLPMGTRIRVRKAGAYSGTYTVTDTGSKVRGRHIDIFVPGRHNARNFGRKLVEVRILEWGRG